MKLLTKFLPLAITATLLIADTSSAAVGPSSAKYRVPTPTPAHHRLVSKASLNPASTLNGYTPGQVAQAYGLSNSESNPLPIGITVAYHYPGLINDVNAEISSVNADLKLRRQPLKPLLVSCTTATQRGCIVVTDAAGGQNYPTNDWNWTAEEVLDVYTAYSFSPRSRIIVAEADQPAYFDARGLGAAIATTERLGAKVVNMSWTSSEWSGEGDFASRYLSTPGVRYVAASGDGGYNATFPGTATNVVSVGGTSLNIANGQRVSETAWMGTGSGCSLYMSKPSDQRGNICGGKKYQNDVSALADPMTGLRITVQGSQFPLGGTSLASPIIAAIYAQAGSANVRPSSTRNLYDVRSGSNGACTNSVLCSAGLGLDGPTGYGAPSGLRAFRR